MVELRYNFHISAKHNTVFLHHYLFDQMALGHIVVLPWMSIKAFLRICMILVGLITQEGHPLQLIYDYTWRYLNAVVFR